jgi:class 3 adenylate cyclase
MSDPVGRWLATADGTATILFTDLVGSTELLMRVGEGSWLETLRAHNAIVHAEVRAQGGAEVKFLGDGWMVVFTEPLDALRCSVGIQSALAAFDGEPLRLRMGIHTGTPIKEGADFLGKDVIVAARLADRAGPGEILVSSVVRIAGLGNGLDFQDARYVDLKGLGTVVAFPVRWTSDVPASL